MKLSLHRVSMVIATGLALVLGIGLSSVSTMPARAESMEAASSDEVVSEDATSETALDAVAPAFPAGANVTVPAGKNQVAADVLGLGYEQVVRLNGSKVEIVDPVTRGSKVLRSFEAGASAAWPLDAANSPLFYGGANMTKKVAGHSASRLAVAGTHIYVSNLQKKDHKANGTLTRRFTVDGVVVNTRVEQAAFAVTSMDGFVWKGKEYVAIGLNYTGVRILEVDRAGMPDRRVMLSHWNGPHRKGSPLGGVSQRDQIIEVKFGVDEHGRFIVVAGAVTTEMPALVALEVETEREIWTKNFRPWNHAWEWPEVIEMGPFGPNGRVSLAVGWPTLGHLEIMDAASGHERKRFTGGVASVVRFFTDASGEQRLAFRRGIGNVWDASIARPDPSGTPVVMATVGGDALEWMVPGSRAWSVQVENRSRSEISLRSFAGASRAEGCWLGTGFRGVPNPLPTQPESIPAGARSTPFVTAQKVWGDSCGDNQGVVYLQIDSAGEPTQRHVVQLHADERGLRVKEQVGASRLTVQTEPDGPLGSRIVVSDRFAPPTVVGAPVIDAIRLTPTPVEKHEPTDDVNDPSRPVHRFTVSGLVWEVPGAGAGLAEATLTLPFAEASVDGEAWDRLGTIASPVAPTRDGDRITMGPAVFDWQTTFGATKDYRYFRVSADGTISDSVDVKPLRAPAPTAVVSKVLIAGGSAPRANGLDQMAMRVSLLGELSRGLDPAEYPEWYQRIYYRDPTTKALITGLGDPANPSQLLMFSLRPGQYANDGLSAEAGTSIGAYFSTRSAQQTRSVMAVFKLNGTADPRTSVQTATSSLFQPVTKALLPEGTGAGGLLVGTCTEGACTLADPEVAPALHSLTATSVSLQLSTRAAPGTASLPLTEPDQRAEHLLLRSDVLKIRGSRATLSNPNSLGGSKMLATTLVTHGDRLFLENHYVK